MTLSIQYAYDHTFQSLFALSRSSFLLLKNSVQTMQANIPMLSIRTVA